MKCCVRRCFIYFSCKMISWIFISALKLEWKNPLMHWISSAQVMLTLYCTWKAVFCERPSVLKSNIGGSKFWPKCPHTQVETEISKGKKNRAHQNLVSSSRLPLFWEAMGIKWLLKFCSNKRHFVKSRFSAHPMCITTSSHVQLCILCSTLT